LKQDLPDEAISWIKKTLALPFYRPKPEVAAAEADLIRKQTPTIGSILKKSYQYNDPETGEPLPPIEFIVQERIPAMQGMAPGEYIVIGGDGYGLECAPQLFGFAYGTPKREEMVQAFAQYGFRPQFMPADGVEYFYPGQLPGGKTLADDVRAGILTDAGIRPEVAVLPLNQIESRANKREANIFHTWHWRLLRKIAGVNNSIRVYKFLPEQSTTIEHTAPIIEIEGKGTTLNFALLGNHYVKIIPANDDAQLIWFKNLYPNGFVAVYGRGISNLAATAAKERMLIDRQDLDGEFIGYLEEMRPIILNSPPDTRALIGIRNEIQTYRARLESLDIANPRGEAELGIIQGILEGKR
jgi:hypothetical protein